jgi:hypothetical protein
VNPYPATAIMQRMATLIPLGLDGAIPSFVQKGGQVYVQNRFQLSQGSFPAMHLESGVQSHTRYSGGSSFIGKLQVIMSLYDRSDANTQTMDAIRASLDSDIELVMALFQDNENLAYNGTAMATSIPGFSVSAYRGEIETELIPGVKLVYRTLVPTLNILPYD